MTDQVPVWQSQVEIEQYSVAHFDHIMAFEALQCRSSVKVGLICAVN